jgi:hypothetical protein
LRSWSYWTLVDVWLACRVTVLILDLREELLRFYRLYCVVAVDFAEMGVETQAIPSPGLGYEVETAVGVYELWFRKSVYTGVGKF